MVTLQILVLSFLVRIQVAQLKRLSFEGRFFLLGFALGGGKRIVMLTNNKSSAFVIDASISRHKKFFVLENITHLTHLSHLSHQPYSPALAFKAQKKKVAESLLPSATIIYKVSSVMVVALR